VTKDRNEVLSWLGANDKAAAFVREQASKTRPFEELGREWLAGVEAGRISRRRGRGQPYSDTTIADYRRSYRNVLEPVFGPMVADEIGEVEWQMFVDRLASEGLSRSRIASHVAVASAIYSWALVPSRRFVSRNPLRLVELPPNDEKPACGSPWRPRPPLSSPPSNRSTTSGTRSPSTPASAAPSSIASNGQTSSTATASRRGSTS
jgi:hypothetical protein